MDRVGVLLIVAIVFFAVNLKAGESWLKLLTMLGMISFLGLACFEALRYVGILGS